MYKHRKKGSAGSTLTHAPAACSPWGGDKYLHRATDAKQGAETIDAHFVPKELPGRAFPRRAAIAIHPGLGVLGKGIVVN